MNIDIGMTLLHPRHGVSHVREIFDREIGGNVVSYVTLEVEANAMTIQVPVANLDVLGVRPPMDESQLAKLRSVLEAEGAEEPENWSRRFKATEEKMRTGDPLRLAEVVRDLSRRAQASHLSPGEKTMQAQAEHLLWTEVGLALGVSPEEASVVLLSPEKA